MPLSISSLPNELIVLVLNSVTAQRDVAALCRTNRRLYDAVSPILYKNAVDRQDMWPLAFAALSGCASTLRKLVAAGADPNHRFTAANTPFRVLDLLASDPDRVVPPPNAAFGLSSKSRRLLGTGLRYLDGHDSWSPSDAEDDFVDDFHGNSHIPDLNAALNVWGTHHPLLQDDGNGIDLTGSELDFLDDVDEDISNASSLTDFSSTDSSTLDDSDRDRDGRGQIYVIARTQYFTSLHIAAAMGNTDVVEMLLDKGALTDVRSRLFCTCRHAVGMLNNIESPEPVEHAPLWTPLHVAICHNRVDIAMLLLSRGSSCAMEIVLDPNTSAVGRSTALHYAAALGQVDLVKFLVEKGHQTDIDVRDDRTLTPLYYAYANSQWNTTIPLLLEMGADINVEIKFYQPYCAITPLGEAIRLGNFQDAQKLVDLGADSSHGFVSSGTGHRKGLSPLHLGCMKSALPKTGPASFTELGTSEQRKKMMETFIAKGLDIHATDCSGDTPLISAAQNLVLPSLEALIAAGADVNARNSLGCTVLMQAVLGPPPAPGSGDRTEHDVRAISAVLHELIRSGAGLCDTDPAGNNVLHLLFAPDRRPNAALAADLSQVLIGLRGAEMLLSARNKQGLLAFEVAFTTGFITACEIMLRRGSVQQALASDDLLRMFKHATLLSPPCPRLLSIVLDLDFHNILLSDPERFCEVMTKNYWSFTSVIARHGIPPLTKAMISKLLRRSLITSQWTVVSELIKHGADVNTCWEPDGTTPLILALDQAFVAGEGDRRKIVETVQLLVDQGANIHHSPVDGSRALTTAIVVESSEFLVKAMLRGNPLRNDVRAVGGCYLHAALQLTESDSASLAIVFALIRSGADLTELDKDGNYPMAVLLNQLWLFTSSYHYGAWDVFPDWTPILPDLFAPGICITRPNKDGLSIVDLLEKFLATNFGRLYAAPIVDLVEGEGGPKAPKVLRFKPEMRPRRVANRFPAVTIWDRTLDTLHLNSTYSV